MKKLFLTGLALLLVLGSLSGLCADNGKWFKVTAPREIKDIINPEPSFYVRAWVDHEDCVYREGETMTVWAKSEKDGWIYVVYQDAEGNKGLLFPNDYRKDNRIQGNQEIRIPADETKDFSLECGAPFGVEYLTVIVTKKPLKSVAEKDLGDQLTPFDDVFYRDFCKEVNSKGFLVKDPTGKNKTENTDQKEKPNSSKPNTEKPKQPTIEWAESVIKITTLPKEAKAVVRVSERYFFGIAIDVYGDKNIPKLPACVNDLKKVKELFINDCNVPAKNTKVLVNEEATFEGIRDLFYNDIPEMTQPGDTVFIYWSGHGNRIANSSSDGDSDKEQIEYHETLLAYDSVKFEKETQLIDDEFGVWVQKLEGRKVLFILDSCYSGGMGVATKSLDQEEIPFEFGLKQFVRTKGLGQEELALIGSSAADERSLCIGNVSVMTNVMLETLKSRKEVSHIDLADELKNKVSALVEKKGSGYSQHPYFQNDLSEPLILNP